jgi:hypothetical protein
MPWRAACDIIAERMEHRAKSISQNSKDKKSQISSTKLQKNHKFQYSMTQTFISAISHSSTGLNIQKKSGFGTAVDRSFIWNFEFGSLGFVCDLAFGAWNFLDFHKAGNFFDISQLLLQMK